MTELIKISKMFLSIIVFIFITQILFEQTSPFPLKIIEYIHDSPLKGSLIYISKVFSYLIIGLLLVFYFLYTFVVNPNVIDNTLSIIYICTTCFVCAYTKLILAELRPFMYAYLTKISKLWVFDCESDYGAPSTNIFYAVIVYYLFKTRFFERRYHIVLSEYRQDDRDNDFRSEFFEMEKNGYNYKEEGCKIFGSFFPLSLFNIIFYSYIGGLVFFRYVAGSHFLLQLICSLIMVFFWSNIFFCYLRLKIRKFIADIVTHPNTRLRTTKYFNLIIYLLIFHTLIMAFCRSYFQNQTETDSLYHLIRKKCDHFYTVENQSLKDSLILIFPIFLLNFYNFFNIKSSLSNPQKKNQTYFDLDGKKKFFRYFFFLLFSGLTFLIKLSVDYIVIKNTESDFFNGYNMVIYGIFMILLAAFIGILFPYLMIKNDCLLKYELLYDEDFEKINTGKNPKKKTEIFIVADSKKEEKFERGIIKGKKRKFVDFGNGDDDEGGADFQTKMEMKKAELLAKFSL